MLTEIEPQTEQPSSDTEADRITSGFTKCFVMMAMCDEAKTRAWLSGLRLWRRGSRALVQGVVKDIGGQKLVIRSLGSYSSAS